MTDYGTIKLPRDEYEQHNERRKDMGLTWSEHVNGEAPDTREGLDLADQLDRIESAAKEATNAAQNAERAAEELQR